MAVYAVLTDEDFVQIAERFSLSTVEQVVGIPQGSINSNYFLTTSNGRFFVRHTLVRSAADLSFEADLLTHLAAEGFPGPQLIRTGRGEPFWELQGGRVSVFSFLPGEEMTRSRLTPQHCEHLGRELGKLHRIANSFGGQRVNPYGPKTVADWVSQLAHHRDSELASIALELGAALDEAEARAGQLVPRGVIHADLFMDNVKWVGDQVSAFFDFEMACVDRLALDLAITLNAWCFAGGYDRDKCHALVGGYQQERRLSPEEKEHLFSAALFGAVRYTASRIRDFHLSTLSADRLQKKDFRTYLARVRELRSIGPKGLWQLTFA